MSYDSAVQYLSARRRLLKLPFHSAAPKPATRFFEFDKPTRDDDVDANEQRKSGKVTRVCIDRGDDRFSRTFVRRISARKEIRPPSTTIRPRAHSH